MLLCWLMVVFFRIFSLRCGAGAGFGLVRRGGGTTASRLAMLMRTSTLDIQCMSECSKSGMVFNLPRVRAVERLAGGYEDRLPPSRRFHRDTCPKEGASWT
jgi:hypothetical protein